MAEGVLDLYVNEGLVRMVDDSLVYMRGFGETPTDLSSPAPSLRVLGKGSKERIVPVGSYARAAVAAYLVRSRPVLAGRGAGTPALFLNARGGRLSRQSAWSILRDVAVRAGISTDFPPTSTSWCCSASRPPVIREMSSS